MSIDKKEKLVTESLRSLIKEEINRTKMFRGPKEDLPKPREINPSNNNEYLNSLLCFPKTFLDKLTYQYFEEKLPSNFMQQFRPGYKICYAPFPFNDLGNNMAPLSDEKDRFMEEEFAKFIEKNAFMNVVGVDPIKDMSYGFGNDKSTPGYYYDFFPEILKRDISLGGCSFVVNYPSNDYNENRKWLLIKLSQAVVNVKTALNKYKVQNLKRFA